MEGHRANVLASAEIGETLRGVVTIARGQLAGRHYRILLFGSWARGTALPTSDLDIAIDAPGLESATMTRIREQVDELPTLRKIDVVDVGEMDAGFRRVALDDAVLLESR